MIGVLVRLHDLCGDDLGTAHVPTPVANDDLVATVDGEYRVVDVVTSPPGSVIGALVKVAPVHLRLAAR